MGGVDAGRRGLLLAGMLAAIGAALVTAAVCCSGSAGRFGRSGRSDICIDGTHQNAPRTQYGSAGDTSARTHALLQLRVASRVEELRRKLGDGCIVDSAGPFVIAGNVSKAQLERYRDETILAAANRAWKMYFTRRPDFVITILLFKDKSSYRRYAERFFGDTDVPRFGYYKRSSHTMLMNISTGGGTLVHELMHALMEADFPQVPDWFNEGLASLYEQCRFDADEMVGLNNWRLSALKKAIREHKLRTLKDLLLGGDFYAPPTCALNYAHARYFCQFMQDKGVLKRFYKRFRDNCKDDPTGLKFLQEVFNGWSVERIEVEFLNYVDRL